MIAKFYDKVKIFDKCIIGGPSQQLFPYNLWQFTASPGTKLNNVKLNFEPSTTMQIDWGDGSVETITSSTNYNHTF